jgi:hypothetical protein
MKKIIATHLAVLFFTALTAQTDKEDWMVGGSFRLNTLKNQTEIAFTPNAGFFAIHNFALGGQLNVEYSKVVSTKITNFGIGPFVRYYFTNAKVRPLIHANFNYDKTRVKPGTGDASTNSGLDYFLGGGFAAFVSDQVSLDVVMGYYHTKPQGFDGYGGFALTIGFQVYLLKRQVNRLGR